VRLLSRRDLLLSGSAFALTGIAGTHYDVLVVGAGAAGIAAARTIRAAGGSALILEASHRVGGRVAGSVLSNVSRRECGLHALVARSGASTIAATSLPMRRMRDESPFAATYAAMLTALIGAGELVRDGSARDMHVYDAVRALRERDGFRGALALLGIDDEYRASLLDYHLVANRAASPFVFPADDTLIVPSGLHTVLADVAKGVPVVRDARVTAIAYRGGEAVLRTEKGETYRARRAIVTVPAGVLASRAIAFSPALPETIAAAVAALPMGVFGRVASSYATVGNAGARSALARHVDGTLWFAGEATAPPGFGCVEGAWESGAAAARAALTA